MSNLELFFTARYQEEYWAYFKSYYAFEINDSEYSMHASMIKNPNIPLNIILDICKDFLDLAYRLSFNPNITWELIENNLDKGWNFILLSAHSMCYSLF